MQGSPRSSSGSYSDRVPSIQRIALPRGFATPLRGKEGANPPLTPQRRSQLIRDGGGKGAATMGQTFGLLKLCLSLVRRELSSRTPRVRGPATITQPNRAGTLRLTSLQISA